MLDLIHLYRYHEEREKYNAWYRRVPANLSYDMPDEFYATFGEPQGLALFIVPQYVITTGGQLVKWNNFTNKMPAKGIHLTYEPGKKNQRTWMLLRATRGLMMFTNQYDPEWFKKPEDMAYFLGFNESKIMSYYNKFSITADYIFRKNLPAVYHEGVADATFKI